MSHIEGPTKQRLQHADGHVSIGGEHRRYQFRDDVLSRTYLPMIRKADTDALRERLVFEYQALNRFYDVCVQSGMIGTISSIDPSKLHGSDPFTRTHLAKTERQVSDRRAYDRARARLVGHPWTVGSYVVENGKTLEEAGYAIGATSERRAPEKARKVLREAGYKLAEMWGMLPKRLTE